jgi:hypothetical protein
VPGGEVGPLRLMKRLSIDIADWNFVALVRALRSTERFSPRAIASGDCLKMPDGKSIALDVSATRRTQLLRLPF